jgi:glycyl-tRNA synthetase beta chain
VDPRESELHAALEALEPEARRLLADRDYDGFYTAAARLRPAVDRFLDGVLVMAEDPRLRANRLGLLRRVAELLSAPLALSRLALGGR